MSVDIANGTRTTGDTAEHMIFTGRGVLFGVYPELTTTGTITIRDGALADGSGAIVHVCAIGLTQAGKSFGDQRGIQFLKGCTVQLSVATDLSLIKWAPLP
jgi:hypothetical protein